MIEYIVVICNGMVTNVMSFSIDKMWMLYKHRIHICIIQPIRCFLFTC